VVYGFLGVNYMWVGVVVVVIMVTSVNHMSDLKSPPTHERSVGQSHMWQLNATDARKLAIVMMTVAVVTGAILAKMTP